MDVQPPPENPDFIVVRFVAQTGNNLLQFGRLHLALFLLDILRGLEPDVGESPLAAAWIFVKTSLRLQDAQGLCHINLRLPLHSAKAGDMEPEWVKVAQERL